MVTKCTEEVLNQSMNGNLEKNFMMEVHCASEQKIFYLFRPRSQNFWLAFKDSTSKSIYIIITFFLEANWDFRSLLLRCKEVE